MQQPGQTQQPTTIKIVMHIPEGIPCGHFLENLQLSTLPPRKIAFFCEFGLRKNYGHPAKKVWYNPQAKPYGLQRSKVACTYLKGFPMDDFPEILKINFSPKNAFFGDSYLEKLRFLISMQSLVHRPG